MAMDIKASVDEQDNLPASKSTEVSGSVEDTTCLEHRPSVTDGFRERNVREDVNVF